MDEVPGEGITDARSIGADLQGNVYVAGVTEDDEGVPSWVVRRSTTGDSGTWQEFDRVASGVACRIMVANDGTLLVMGSDLKEGEAIFDATVRSNQSGTWKTVVSVEADSESFFLASTCDTAGNLYFGGGTKLDKTQTPVIYTTNLAHLQDALKAP